jgi:FkbM family methyltransferase
MLRDLCEPGMVVFDVGANVGTHTLALAEAVGSNGTVVAFEPQSQAYDALETNVAHNDFGTVQTENAALGSETETAQLHVEHDDPGVGSHSLRRRSEDIATTETIQVIRGDEYVSQTGTIPDLIKIDVEGAEQAVLKGLDQTLKEHSPILVVEVHDIANGDAVRDYLRSLGYALTESDVDKEILLAE